MTNAPAVALTCRSKETLPARRTTGSPACIHATVPPWIAVVPGRASAKREQALDARAPDWQMNATGESERTAPASADSSS
jgi:hypothetical protein